MNQAQRLQAARRKAKRTAIVLGAVAFLVYISMFWWGA
jgi:hypothetical protein